MGLISCSPPSFIQNWSTLISSYYNRFVLMWLKALTSYFKQWKWTSMKSKALKLRIIIKLHLPLHYMNFMKQVLGSYHHHFAWKSSFMSWDKPKGTLVRHLFARVCFSIHELTIEITLQVYLNHQSIHYMFYISIAFRDVSFYKSFSQITVHKSSQTRHWIKLINYIA